MKKLLIGMFLLSVSPLARRKSDGRNVLRACGTRWRSGRAARVLRQDDRAKSLHPRQGKRHRNQRGRCAQIRVLHHRDALFFARIRATLPGSRFGNRAREVLNSLMANVSVHAGDFGAGVANANFDTGLIYFPWRDHSDGFDYLEDIEEVAVADENSVKRLGGTIGLGATGALLL